MLSEILKISFTAYIFIWLGDPEEIFGWYQRLIKDLPMWLWKPLGGCVKCFTGQVCLWYYIIAHYENYNVLNHGFFIAGSVFLAWLYELIFAVINKLKDRYETTKT